jgi:hypothetical protein
MECDSPPLKAHKTKSSGLRKRRCKWAAALPAPAEAGMRMKSCLLHCHARARECSHVVLAGMSAGLRALLDVATGASKACRGATRAAYPYPPIERRQ